MRLSLRKGAHAVLSSAAWQEIRVRSVEKHFHERSAELQIPRLPRISCRTWWRWRTSCAFPYGKAHTRPCLAQRGRKSGYARDDKGEGDASMESGCWTEGVFHHLGWAEGDENAFEPGQPLSMEAPPSPLSSRAQPRDLQFSGPFVEMFFDRASQPSAGSAISRRLIFPTIGP